MFFLSYVKYKLPVIVFKVCMAGPWVLSCPPALVLSVWLVITTARVLFLLFFPLFLRNNSFCSTLHVWAG